MGRRKQIDSEPEGGVEFIAAGADHSCATRQAKWCVWVCRQDGSAVHNHFKEHELAAANQRARAIRAEAHAPNKPRASDQSRLTFEEYAKVWYDTVKEDSSDPESIWNALKRAFPDRRDSPGGVCGKTVMSEVTGLGLGALQADLLSQPVARGNKPYARGSVATTMVYVNQMMKQAINDGVVEIKIGALPKSPARRKGGKRKEVRQVTKKQVPTRDEARAIMAGAPARWRAAIVLGFWTGMRIGEILGLRPIDIDFAEGTIRIEEQQQRRGRVTPKTEKGIRTIDVDDVVLAELRTLVDGLPLLASIFAGSRGGVPRRDDFYKHGWKPALRGAGLPDTQYVFHATRHFCVSLMLKTTNDVAAVADYVGDEVQTITETYWHWIDGSEASPAQAMAAAMAPTRRGPLRRVQ